MLGDEESYRKVARTLRSLLKASRGYDKFAILDIKTILTRIVDIPKDHFYSNFSTAGIITGQYNNHFVMLSPPPPSPVPPAPELISTDADLEPGDLAIFDSITKPVIVPGFAYYYDVLDLFIIKNIDLDFTEKGKEVDVIDKFVDFIDEKYKDKVEREVMKLRPKIFIDFNDIVKFDESLAHTIARDMLNVSRSIFYAIESYITVKGLQLTEPNGVYQKGDILVFTKEFIVTLSKVTDSSFGTDDLKRLGGEDKGNYIEINFRKLVKTLAKMSAEESIPS